MKIRNGFVSNSSSSSFVVSSKSRDNLKVKIEIDLNNLIESEISNIEELTFYVKENYGYNTLEGACLDDPYVKKFIEKAKKCLEKGQILYTGTVSDYGEGGGEMGDFLRRSGLQNNINKDVEIIEDCNCL